MLRGNRQKLMTTKQKWLFGSIAPKAYGRVNINFSLSLLGKIKHGPPIMGYFGAVGLTTLVDTAAAKYVRIVLSSQQGRQKIRLSYSHKETKTWTQQKLSIWLTT
jgi:hypothetical protein